MRKTVLLGCLAIIAFGAALARDDHDPAKQHPSHPDLVIEGSGITTASPPEGRELVQNGGFEGPFGEDGISSGWLDNSSWAPLNARYDKESAAPRSGEFSQILEVTNFQGGAAQLIQTGIPITQYKTYRLSAWMRGDVPGLVELKVRQAEQPYRDYLSRSFQIDGEWRKYTVEDVVEDSDSAAIVIVRLTSNGKLWIDDVSLRELGDAAVAVTLSPPAITIPTEYFGVHIHRVAGLFPDVPPTPWPTEIPFKTRRLWDSGVSWPQLEPEKGKWNFEILDRVVEEAAANGVELLLPLGLSPKWASARPTEISAYDDANADEGSGMAAEPASMDDWRNYVRTVALRYHGKIRLFEIWNEPNNNVPPFAFFTGTPEKLAELTREAALILKEVDPANRVISSAVVMNTGYLDAYFAAGGAQHADIIGYHFYIGLGSEDVSLSSPERMVREVAKVREVMLKHGVQEKPLWDTESGWHIQSETRPENVTGFVPMSLAGDYLARACILEWALGIERYYHYMWDSDTMGMLEEGNVPKTIVHSHYRPIFDWLVGARMLSLESPDRRTWICVLERDGKKQYVVWDTHGARHFHIPKAWDVSSSQRLGSSSDPIAPERLVQIGTTPILLE